MLKSLNKVQKSAVQSFGKPVLIFAGAGSGKTRVLTHKIAYLANENLIPEKYTSCNIYKQSCSRNEYESG